ncbi:MAG: hypothetical protein GX257_10955 [Clostridiales bacterium]|nr:hypothetical protein [Clostridiales bacterium]
MKQRTGEKKVEKTLIFALDTSTETWYVDLVKMRKTIPGSTRTGEKKLKKI